MRYLATIATACVLAGCATVDETVTDTSEVGYGWSLEPFWATSVMHEESVLFVQESPDTRPTASLLFTPREILRVEQPASGRVLEEGTDYTLSRDKRTLTLPEASRIAFKTLEELYPAPGAEQSIGAKRDSDRHLLFSEGHYFHDLQVEVTYTHSGREWRQWGGYIPHTTTRQLQATKIKLKDGAPVHIVLFGDSISAGANASATTGAQPFMPPYGLLAARGLEAYYGREIKFSNMSVGGKATDWGVQVIDDVSRHRPDLLIIAFGMNDASAQISAEQYQRNIKRMMEGVQRLNPGAEFILVATMTGNPEWTYSSMEHYKAYREKLLELQSDSVAVADMTSVWLEFLKHKKLLDITGNGVNHPNDFGHRIYAQVILSLLSESYLALPDLPNVPRPRL